jgi:hypothetical protein
VLPKRRHAWLGFALTAALGLVSVLVLRGAAAGVTSLLTLLAFIAACIYALRGRDADITGRTERAGLRGWAGGWF